MRSGWGCHLQPKATGVHNCWSFTSILWLLTLLTQACFANGMTSVHLESLRQETEQLFYHGYDNYMTYAFPEDELRPLSCAPLTRDVANPGNIGLNDPLGNYSLTLVDSLSTLAILASASGPSSKRAKAFRQFQEAVATIVEHYGDGSDGSRGVGSRAKGFDLDSKVQVFETVIRGVGGLLSAHLFAVGELPITDYKPNTLFQQGRNSRNGIKWSSSFTYDGQLLRLAHDLGKRLLPAFSTSTGIPYPRVNLRHGIPFYRNSPVNCATAGKQAQCAAIPPADRELTETCSAGAGSLVLEFSTLTRLTGDLQFEILAKRAFWSIWKRRSNVGLVGSGIDAETGLWTTPYTGLGAGIDSFFEYAIKSHILLSGTGFPSESASDYDSSSQFEPPPLTEFQHGPDSFLQVWNEAHFAIKRHLYRGDNYVHPHYVQADLNTGAARAFWIDSLSAFFPGVLILAGEVDEAIETHLLFTALWTRYSAIPERWSTASATVEGGLSWWGGRPEFIESTYYIYRATQDPWYLHIGEMVLNDIKRRCWTSCGWAGLQDVRTGDKSDRMESFFLGETAKYLHLLFDPDHPLNQLDKPFVFTTEGHPLIIPKSKRWKRKSGRETAGEHVASIDSRTSCPVPESAIPLTVSNTAARSDIFHAANLARLHLMPRTSTDSSVVEYASDHPSLDGSNMQSPTNYTFFPWTLPQELVPSRGYCSAVESKPSFDITFPMGPAMLLNSGLLQRLKNGILINAMGGVRLGVIQDVSVLDSNTGDGDLFRVHALNSIPLGKDEKIFLTKDTMASVVSEADPNFTRVRNPTMVDIAFDILLTAESNHPQTPQVNSSIAIVTATPEHAAVAEAIAGLETGSPLSNALKFIAQQMSSIIAEPPTKPDPHYHRYWTPAVTNFGPGSAVLPDVVEALGPDIMGNKQGTLIWDKIFIGRQNCDSPLPKHVPRQHQVIVLQRGGCEFSKKLQNIPSFPPNSESLQLVIVVSESNGPGEDDESLFNRPFLDVPQLTPGGLLRHNPIPIVMVSGGEAMYDMLSKAISLGIKRRYSVQAQGIPISNVFIL